MSSIMVILAIIVLGLIVLSKIPGLEHTVKPIIDLLFSGIKFIGENSVSWSIWLFKLLLGSHVAVLQHLILSVDKLDPAAAMEEKAKNQ